MKVNSAKEYRLWVKQQEDRPDIDENFVGCSKVFQDKKVKGFFNLFHGMKDDIDTYLPSLLDIAEDNQAIYEFLQNAVDCGSTHFYAFYNDNYFLAVNNGTKFSLEGLKSILNIAQSTKTDAYSIGRLGIGFKLAHRLVGKGNGTHELIHENKGPVMFSWNKSSDLEALMSDENIEFQGLEENAYLLKIAITNFPAQVEEVVKDIDYQDIVIFPSSELAEFRIYVRECLKELYAHNISSFNQGTLFFIKLGDNKRELLDNDLETLKNGIEYSMNTLKQLNNICFNGETILKKTLVINESFIPKNTDKFIEIDPQYKNYDILYSFGFIPMDFTKNDYFSSVKQLQESPNFYKYFPMGDEVDNMALFIHSDSFQIEANRRKLTNHHTNQKLLPEIANYIVDTLNQYMVSDRTKYLQLYASILLTKKPSSKEKNWMYDIFFNILFKAIKKSIPTIDSNETCLCNVRIKNIKMYIPLDKIGLSNIKWFYWYEDNHKELIDSACEQEMLNLHKWNINNIIEECNIELLNIWLDSCISHEFEAFLDEIKSTTTTNKVKARLSKIKLFNVGDERKSHEEIVNDTDYLIVTSKIKSIIPILTKIGIKCTNEVIENHKLTSLLEHQKEETMFKIIKAKVENIEYWSKLDAGDKLQLITVLKDIEHVGDASIKKLRIFKNILGRQCSLENLTAYKDGVENWQKPYVICKDENFSEVQKYLIDTPTAFSDTIESHFEDIIEGGTTINELYNIYVKNGLQWTDNMTIKMIGAYGCTEEILSLIEKNPSKTAVDEFVTKLGTINLNSTSTYSPSSFEYRYIQVAAKVESILIRKKIKIDEIPLTSFTTSNELSFKCKDQDNVERSFIMKLSDILPDDTQCALYGKVVGMFSSITGYEIIFSADQSNNSNVQSRLKALLSHESAIILPAQYVFILLTQWQSCYTSLSGWDNFIRFGKTDIQIKTTIVGILDYAFENGFEDVLIKYKSFYMWSQHLKGRYMFSCDYTKENERAYKEIEDWCGLDYNKKELLKKLDVRFNDGVEINRRMRFKEDLLNEWDGGDSFPASFIAWVASFQSIEGENQKKLLYNLTNKFNNINLKLVFSEQDYSDAKELDTSKYIAWKPSKSISIYKIKTETTVRIVYNNNQILAYVNNGHYKYFPDTKHLYINGICEESVASVLAQVYQDKNIPFEYQDYISVCFDSYEEQRQKDEIIKKYETLFKCMLESGQKDKIEAIIGAKLNGEEIDTSRQIEENEEAKALVLTKLEKKGFSVSDVDSEWSVIKGVMKDSIEYPLVVKSCKNWNHQLFLNPEEWKQLFKPNSMLWLHFGNNIVVPIKAHELFTYQDKLTLTFDTVNLMMDNRINKIMEVMRYFNNVHLDVATLNPDKRRAEHLEEYLFNDNNVDNSDLDDNVEL